MWLNWTKVTKSIHCRADYIMKVLSEKCRTQQVFLYLPWVGIDTANEIVTADCGCINGNTNRFRNLDKGMLAYCIIFLSCLFNESSFTLMCLHPLENLCCIENCLVMFLTRVIA